MKINFKENLEKIGLDAENAIVIGSGILSALGLRESQDIDVVVDEVAYERLSVDAQFKKADNHGHEVLVGSLFEIGKSWFVLGKEWTFDDFLNHSVVIEGVRYATIQFILDVKKSWALEPDARQKDKDDIKLIEEYLKKN